MRRLFLSVVVFVLLGVAGSTARAQESCANLQSQLQTLRSSGGAGSQWDSFIQQRMQQLGCFGGGYQGQNVCPNGGTCRSDQTCCGSYCCNEGHYCSRYGCTPQGASDCGGWYCNPGLTCSRAYNKCTPAGRVDCGNWNCSPGQRCGSSHNSCLSEGDSDCGSYTCRSGYKCSSAGCISDEAVDCGNKTYCNAGTKCSRSGKKCLQPDEVDCGSYSCNAGWKCGSANSCLQRDAIDCGGGRSCPSGHVCLRGGAECLTRSEIAEREAAEKRRKEEEIAERKRVASERAAEERRRVEQEKEAARQRAAEAKRLEQERLNAQARQKLEEQLRLNAQKQRQAELQLAAKQKQQELQARAGTSQDGCAYQKIVAISEGRNPDSVVCAATPARQPTIQAAPAPAVPNKQLQYLQQNAVKLQPPAPATEQRTISLQPESVAAPVFPVCSTFNDPTLAKGGCPPPQAKQPGVVSQETSRTDTKASDIDAEKKATPEEQAAEDAKQEKEMKDNANAKIIGALCQTEDKEECWTPVLWWKGCTYIDVSQTAQIATPDTGQWCQKSTRKWMYVRSILGQPKCSPGEWITQEKVCQPKSYTPQKSMVYPVFK
jgi:hypothetical protein